MLIDVFNLWQVGDRNAVALIDPSMSDEQEKLIVETIGENGRVALMLDENGAGRSGSQDALIRLVSQVYVKQIRLGIAEDLFISIRKSLTKFPPRDRYQAHTL